MCSVGLSDADLADAPSAEAAGRTVTVTGCVGVTHVWFLLMLSQSASVRTVPRSPSDYSFVGMLMTHFWR